MLAMFFFIALYMQNVRGYSPLEAGVRFLPSTVVIIFMGPIAGRLADKVGPRPLMSLGLVLVSVVAVRRRASSRPTRATRYLAVGFVLMGIGMGLVMSPMSTAAMNAVDQTKAGAASGVLSMSRMVGGTFGVAVMGALIPTLGRRHLQDSAPAASRRPDRPARRRARHRRRRASPERRCGRADRVPRRGQHGTEDRLGRSRSSARSSRGC